MDFYASAQIDLDKRKIPKSVFQANILDGLTQFLTEMTALSQNGVRAMCFLHKDTSICNKMFAN